MKKPMDRQQVDAELQQVVELRHPEPHRVLGIHPDGDAMVVRAFRPDAVAIHVLPESGGRVPMTHRLGGVYEARINGKTEHFNYLIEVEYPGNKKFTLRAKNQSPENAYIQSAQLNGQPFTRTYLKHEEITAGGELTVEMGPQPNLTWGTGADDIPPSLGMERMK